MTIGNRTYRRRRTREPGQRAATLLSAAAGAGAMYLLDPQQGRRRRHVTRDKALKLARRGGRSAEQRARYAKDSASGHIHEATSSATPPAGGEPDDATLARTVESRIFRSDDVPKGSIVVNAEHGVVYLRGTSPSAQLSERLAAQAREVPGVIAVKSLLHDEGEPAPSVEEVRPTASA